MELIEGEYRYGFHDEEKPVYKTPKGLSEKVVREISALKKEPEWMLRCRLNGLKEFFKKPLPAWGPDLSGIDFQEVCYYTKSSEQKYRSWGDVPENLKRTFERLGIPEAERRFLAGAGAQYDSESVYHHLKEELEAQGVVFLDMDSGLREHERVVKKYFGTVVPASDNKFAALNTAVWSGGSFIYVPKGVSVEVPVQAYFRINARNVGQFERTLIIADEGSSVHYQEGCSAPVYSANALHAAVVEIIALRKSRVQYTTIQNWSTNVYNLVTKRAKAYGDATVFWLDGNLGSKTSMKYPAVLLMEPGARAEMLSISLAGKGQHQDVGAKMIHLAPETSSIINSRSISKAGGRSVYRGLVKVAPNARNAKARVECRALILDKQSASDTVPVVEVNGREACVSHEASVSKLDDEKLFYLQARGLTEQKARQLLVQGFIEPFVKELPMEYAVELNRLVDLEMEEAVA